MRIAIVGTGFWARYQIPAWQELEGVEIVAAYNRTRSKAEEMAQKFRISKVYDNVESLLLNEELDCIDIITDVDTHPIFVKMAAESGVNVICQKPMAASFALAQEMTKVCRKQG
jgi:predicted dehydrogenase